MDTSPNKPHILVIDDESGICLTVYLLLSDQYRVSTASTPTEALACLDTSVDLVLLDLRMPGVAGFTLLDTLHAAFPRTPIVLFSACGDGLSTQALQEHGAVGLINKPFSRQELLDGIRDILVTC